MTQNSALSIHFGESYYYRYYTNSRSAVISPGAARNEVRFVLSFCDHICLDLRRFADVGAGTGWWAREFKRQRPSCRYVETYDASADAARLFGHRRVPLEELGGRPADLVVCRDVLRYLPDTRARRGIRRLAKKSRGVLYLHVITREDEVDEEASDMSGHFRPAGWYLKELAAAGFINAGMGLFVSPKFERFDPFSLEVR